MLGDLTPTTVITVLVCVLVSMVVHEFMHAFVSHKLGDTTAFDNGRLTLNPLQHIDPVMTLLLPVVSILIFHVPILAAKPVPVNSARLKYDDYGMALVAAAGPLSNLVLAFIAALVSRAFEAGSLMAQILDVFIQLNVALFVFNLLPIPPLDGSRVLYAFAPRALREIMEQIEPYGIFIVFALVLLPNIGLGTLLYSLNQSVLSWLP